MLDNILIILSKKGSLNSQPNLDEKYEYKKEYRSCMMPFSVIGLSLKERV